MKKIIYLSIFAFAFNPFCSIAQSQTDEPSSTKKETQEITIRKKGTKDSKLTIELTGDKVLINGKPMAEFSEEGITINNKKIIVKDGNNLSFNFGDRLNGEINRQMDGSLFNEDYNENRTTKSNTFLGVTTEENDGAAKIIGVTKESPAEKAGLQNGDIIYKIDDNILSASTTLSSIIRAKKANDKVKIYFKRDGKNKDVKATLGTKNEDVVVRGFRYNLPNGNIKTLTIPAPPNFNGNNFEFPSSPETVFGFRSRPKLGIKIQDTEDGKAVKILEVEPTTAAATAGLLKDDLITEIAGKKIENTDEARAQLQENNDKSSYEIKVKRKEAEMTFTIKIPKKLKTATL